MRLREAEVDKTYRVLSFQTERRMRQRLSDMGLITACNFLVVMNSRMGPVLIEVRGTRLVIGNEMTSKIMVESIL